MRPPDFVISGMSWLVSGGLRCRMPVETESLCASPAPNGELWSGRLKPSIPSQPVGPRWRSGSATSWWPTPEKSSAWKSPAQRYVTPWAGFRTGSVGVSPALCVVPPPVGAKNADAQKPRCQRSQAEEGTPPLITLPTTQHQKDQNRGRSTPWAPRPGTIGRLQSTTKGVSELEPKTHVVV